MFEPVIDASGKARPHPAPIAGIGYVAVLLSSLFVSCVANNYIQEEKETENAHLLRDLGPGDLVETNDGKIYAATNIPRANDYLILLALPYSAPQTESVQAIAKKIVRVVRSDDTAWPETARSYLLVPKPDSN